MLKLLVAKLSLLQTLGISFFLINFVVEIETFAKVRNCWELRIKKTKYISIFLVLAFFALTGFSRSSSAKGIASNRNTLLANNSVFRDTSGLGMDDYMLSVDSASNSMSDNLVVSDSSANDSLTERKPFLDDVISGSNEDSLVYDIRNKTVHMYEKGSVDYQNMNLQGDYMRIKIDEKVIYAHGRPDDSTGKNTLVYFTDDGEMYTMDTITYNITTGKARIKGISTMQGEGYLTGIKVKKMSDNTINIANGRYTTCDAEHPHFYLAMTKAKAIPGKKVVVGPSYLVMEDVPIYFLGLPFGFFPIYSGRKAGFIMPEYGEEVVKGFFIRNGGYYLTFKDYADMAITAGIYTYGSWEAAVASRYVKRYKYNGGLNIRFSKDIMGEKGSADYVNQNNFNVIWQHSQDARARPNSSFSASVNFATSGYSKYGSQTMDEYLNTQTNSSIAYSKSWAGKPFSFSTNIQHSQNSHDSTVYLGFPNMVFNVSRIYPFRRRNAVGKQRWYEKISLTYTGTMSNSVTVKEKDLFTETMYKDMRNGVNHVIPISTSINLLKYINLSPSANYQERWYFRKIFREWDPELNRVVNSDTTSGFYRVYDYRFSLGASTKIYGTYGLRPKKGSTEIRYPIVRHVITPTISFGYTPDFSKPKYGYYERVQSDAAGNTTLYSPFAEGIYGVPSSGGQSAVMSFGLQQTLEMKVKSDADTTGYKKLKLIDNFNISSSYNFLADSMNLQPFSMTLRANLFKSIGINVSATLDPYQVNSSGQRINKFMLQEGKLGRITSASTSFGYSFRSTQSEKPAMNDINSGVGQATAAEQADFFSQPGFRDMDANTQRRVMSSTYYDFNIPWNFGFNYTLSYANNGLRKTVTQTLGFNGSVNLTEKWGITFDGGYDFEAKKITPGVITISRDLHCWQMNFTWVPIGFRKSWSFSIAVKSSLLKDLKYDRNSSFYDNLYEF